MKVLFEIHNVKVASFTLPFTEAFWRKAENQNSISHPLYGISLEAYKKQTINKFSVYFFFWISMTAKKTLPNTNYWVVQESCSQREIILRKPWTVDFNILFVFSNSSLRVQSYVYSVLQETITSTICNTWNQTFSYQFVKNFGKKWRKMALCINLGTAKKFTSYLIMQRLIWY